jgi:hypothetical protein
MTQLRAVICCLVVTGLAHPVNAQPSPQTERSDERPLTSAAERAVSEAARQPQRRSHHRMPRGFLWTGVGLAGYGGFLIFLGTAYGPDHLDCPGGDCRTCKPDCPKTRATLYRGSLRFLGSGAAVLAVGAAIGASRSPDLVPRISLNRGAVAIHQPVPMRHWWHHAPSRE